MNHKNDNDNHSLELDELIIDRLVDNDLDDQEYRQVLRLVEEKPDGWRQLALAFLESQAFEKELSALKNFPGAGFASGSCESEEEAPNLKIASFNDPSSKIINPESIEPGQSTVPTGRPAEPNSVLAQPDRDGSFWLATRQTLPALAACLAIFVTVGLYVREIQNNRAGELETGQGFNTSDNSSVNPEFIELVSNDPDGRVQTPVYNHQQFDPGTYAREIGSLKPRLQQVVNRPGWTADERTHVVPIKDKTGNRIIVPLNEIKLTPNSFAKYQ